MKPTLKEREFLELLRKLDSRQRDEIIAQAQRQAAANEITRRVGKLRRLKPPDDHKIVKAFGTAPNWKLRSK